MYLISLGFVRELCVVSIPQVHKRLLRKIFFRRILLSMGMNLPWKKEIFIVGKIDTITTEYMKNPIVFADVFNQFLYHGNQKIDPARLTELDTTEIVIPYGASGVSVPEQKYRDVLKLLYAMTDGKTTYCVMGLDNQAEIHYALPVRTFPMKLLPSDWPSNPVHRKSPQQHSESVSHKNTNRSYPGNTSVYQAPPYLSRQPGKIRNLRFGRGDIVAQLIVSLLCLAAIEKSPPAYPFRIIENSGSLNLLVFL